MSYGSFPQHWIDSIDDNEFLYIRKCSKSMQFVKHLKEMEKNRQKKEGRP